MLQQFLNDNMIAISQDRRSNPFIRTRQRRNFDRRKSYRVGASALTFLYRGDEIIYGFLKDISNSGACVEIDGVEKKEWNTFKMGIPLLHREKINCEILWSKENEGNNSHKQYGIKFIGLNNQGKNKLRKRFLLDESLLMAYAEEVMGKIDDFQTKQEIKAFFLIDLRIAIESLIDIDTMVGDGYNDKEIVKRCKETLDKLVNAGDKLELSLNSASLARDIKQRVRALIGHFIYQSTVFRRSFEKPQGYPGDYKTLEIVYNDNEVSEGIGKHIDRYGLDVPYSIAIRLRKDRMKEMLYNFINNSSEEKLNILNLASGACRDIREMFNLPIRYKGKVNLMCIDQDEGALEYSQRKLSLIDTGNININLIKGNILRLESLEIGGDNSLDMVYSIGIADYLQDRMMIKILKDCYKKLKPGGQLVIAYKDRERHKPIALNWYGDWCFIPRNVEEVVRLINNAIGEENISINIERENSGVIFFATITKNKQLEAPRQSRVHFSVSPQKDQFINPLT
jgi:SAM-dependent methyltransferase